MDKEQDRLKEVPKGIGELEESLKRLEVNAYVLLEKLEVVLPQGKIQKLKDGSGDFLKKRQESQPNTLIARHLNDFCLRVNNIDNLITKIIEHLEI